VVSALTATGSEREAGLVRLRGLLVRVAVRELQRRDGSSGIAGPELDDLAHEAAADAMLAIIAKLDTFRGESRFTWAYLFVVLEVSSKLGRHYWRRHPVASLGAEAWTGCRTGSGWIRASRRRRQRWSRPSGTRWTSSSPPASGGCSSRSCSTASRSTPWSPERG
jgi:hypothetical protein